MPGNKTEAPNAEQVFLRARRLKVLNDFIAAMTELGVVVSLSRPEKFLEGEFEFLRLEASRQ